MSDAQRGYRARLTTLLARGGAVSPTRVDALLRRYAGNEEALLAALDAAQQKPPPTHRRRRDSKEDEEDNSSAARRPAAALAVDESTAKDDDRAARTCRRRDIVTDDTDAAALTLHITTTATTTADTTAALSAMSPHATSSCDEGGGDSTNDNDNNDDNTRVEATASSYRARLLALYAHYAPAQAHKVDDYLQRYRGREAALLAAVERKFTTRRATVHATDGDTSDKTTATAVEEAAAAAAAAAEVEAAIDAAATRTAAAAAHDGEHATSDDSNDTVAAATTTATPPAAIAALSSSSPSSLRGATPHDEAAWQAVLPSFFRALGSVNVDGVDYVDHTTCALLLRALHGDDGDSNDDDSARYHDTILGDDTNSAAAVATVNAGAAYVSMTYFVARYMRPLLLSARTDASTRLRRRMADFVARCARAARRYAATSTAREERDVVAAAAAQAIARPPARAYVCGAAYACLLPSVTCTWRRCWVVVRERTTRRKTNSDERRGNSTTSDATRVMSTRSSRDGDAPSRRRRTLYVYHATTQRLHCAIRFADVARCYVDTHACKRSLTTSTTTTTSSGSAFASRHDVVVLVLLSPSRAHAVRLLLCFDQHDAAQQFVQLHRDVTTTATMTRDADMARVTGDVCVRRGRGRRHTHAPATLHDARRLFACDVAAASTADDDNDDGGAAAAIVVWCCPAACARFVPVRWWFVDGCVVHCAVQPSRRHRPRTHDHVNDDDDNTGSNNNDDDDDVRCRWELHDVRRVVRHTLLRSDAKASLSSSAVSSLSSTTTTVASMHGFAVYGNANVLLLRGYTATMAERNAVVSALTRCLVRNAMLAPAQRGQRDDVVLQQLPHAMPGSRVVDAHAKRVAS